MHELSVKPRRTLVQKKYMQRFQAPLVRTKTGYCAVKIMGIFG
jgi:hypothetical protein